MEVTTNKDSNFDHDLAMLNYFQDEFKHRHGHFWTTLIRLFALDIAVILIPISSKLFDINLTTIPEKYKVAFPVIGVVIALITYFLLIDESKKIAAVNNAKYRINQEMDEKYHYIKYVNDMSGETSKMSHKVVKLLFCTELSLCVLVFHICI